MSDLSAEEQAWLEVRRYLEKNRFELGVEAASHYGDHLKFFGTPLLTKESWLPSEPIPLAHIDLQLDETRTSPKSSSEYGAALPESTNGIAYQNYADTYQKLAAPRVFENRTTYRLETAELKPAVSRLSFSLGRYFDSLNTGEASAHAYAADHLGHNAGSIRDSIYDPCDLAQRPVNMAVSALTLRRVSGADFEFFLHWRDPSKVGHAGGLYQVVPSGVFQASGEQSWNQKNDFSLIRFLARELAEELLGRAEVYENTSNGIDYDGWEFYHKLQKALTSGQARAWCVGLGADPLTFATDLLAVLVFERDSFHDIFGEVTSENDEGRVLAAQHFNEATVQKLLHTERMQAAGAALLAAAWQHRDVLLNL